MDEAERALAQQIADQVGDRRVATAESFTAGQIAQALATGDEASHWLLGGVVAYHRDVKYDLLGVPRGPVVNHAAARAMALGAQRVLGAQVAVATTGAAGPTGHDGAEPGTAFLGFAIDGHCDTEEHHFAGEPDDVIRAAVKAALRGLADRFAVRCTP